MHLSSLQEVTRLSNERDAVDAQINKLWDARNTLTERMRSLGVTDEPVQFREAAE